MNEYPIEEKDELGRTVKTVWSSSKTTHKKYWGDTKQIKIIYTVYYNFAGSASTIEIDGFDRRGNIIVNYSNALGVRVLIPGFNLKRSSVDGNVTFTIEDSKIKKWKKLIKNN
jgi:hypothetical protein